MSSPQSCPSKLAMPDLFPSSAGGSIEATTSQKKRSRDELPKSSSSPSKRAICNRVNMARPGSTNERAIAALWDSSPSPRLCPCDHFPQSLSFLKNSKKHLVRPLPRQAVLLAPRFGSRRYPEAFSNINQNKEARLQCSANRSPFLLLEPGNQHESLLIPDVAGESLERQHAPCKKLKMKKISRNPFVDPVFADANL